MRVDLLVPYPYPIQFPGRQTQQSLQMQMSRGAHENWAYWYLEGLLKGICLICLEVLLNLKGHSTCTSPCLSNALRATGGGSAEHWPPLQKNSKDDCQSSASLPIQGDSCQAQRRRLSQRQRVVEGVAEERWEQARLVGTESLE